MKESVVSPKRLAIVLLGLVLAVAGCGFDGDDRSQEPDPPEINGTITASSRLVADSDVNDPRATYRSNDSISEAQELPTPCVVGGYVNLPDKGFDGRSFTAGDVVDFFRVELAAGQIIALYVGGYPEGQLDLTLYNSSQVVVDEALGPAEVLALTAPADGTYYVEVRPSANASLYNLTVGQPAPATAKYGLRLSDDFVPGEAIVRFQTDRRRAASAAIAGSLGMKVKAGNPERALLLDIGGDGDTQAPGSAEARVQGAAAASLQERKRQTLRAISALRGRPDIRSADPNYIRRPFRDVNDPLYPQQWHYALINLPQAWDLTTGSPDVIVAVVDTGVLHNHPDLQGRLIAGYDFVRDPSEAGDGNGLDPNPEDPGNPATGVFHGTHVTGTVAALTDNALGVAGVSHATQVMPLRALGIYGTGDDWDIMQAVRYAARLDNDSGTLPAKKADVINLSLGGPGFSQSAQDDYDEVRAQGVIVIAAAGNDTSTVPLYPASYAGVISVSAVDHLGDLASYSSYGPTIDLAAPGGSRDYGVLSTCGDHSLGFISYDYCNYSGTSMASPHVAGVAAMMKAVHPAMTPEDFDAILVSGLLTNSTIRDDWLGYGRIDAFLAVSAAQEMAGGVPLPPSILTTPDSLYLWAPGEATTASVELQIRNGGSGSLSLSSVAGDPAASWLSVAEKSVGADKLGTFTVTGNPEMVVPGFYSAVITITPVDTAVAVVNLPVRFEVTTSTSGGNIGYLYVLLVDPVTNQTVVQTSVPFDSKTGLYRYRFRNVPPGQYWIVAGTDADHNLNIGELGEAEGAYGRLDEPTPVTVPGVNNNLDLPAVYRVIRP